MNVTCYKNERGFSIVAPFTVERVGHKKRCWSIFGRRGGVSASVHCRAVSVDWPTKREALAFLEANLGVLS